MFTKYGFTHDNWLKTCYGNVAESNNKSAITAAWLNKYFKIPSSKEIKDPSIALTCLRKVQQKCLSSLYVDRII